SSAWGASVWERADGALGAHDACRIRSRQEAAARRANPYRTTPFSSGFGPDRFGKVARVSWGVRTPHTRRDGLRVFVVYVRDMNFARLVRESLRRKLSPNSDKTWVMGFPPLGILMLSSCLKKAGHEVRLFDTAHPRHHEADIVREVEAAKPDLV